MKIKLNNCPKCGGSVECKDVPIYGMGKYFCGKCTKCGLEGERARNKTLAVERWNNGNIRFDEHEVKCRIIQMCQDEIEKTEIRNKVDDMYISELSNMIRYFRR